MLCALVLGEIRSRAMNLLQLLAVSVRFLSIGLFVYALNMSVGVVSMTSVVKDYPLAGFIVPSSLMLISVLLWFFPFTAIASITKGFQIDIDAESHFEFNEVADFLLVLVGIYLLYYVVSDAAYWILILQFTSASDFPIVITPDQKAHIGATVVEAIMAIGLILGRKGIIKLIRRARLGGAA